MKIEGLRKKKKDAKH